MLTTLFSRVKYNMRCAEKNFFPRKSLLPSTINYKTSEKKKKKNNAKKKVNEKKKKKKSSKRRSTDDTMRLQTAQEYLL